MNINKLMLSLLVATSFVNAVFSAEQKQARLKGIEQLLTQTNFSNTAQRLSSTTQESYISWLKGGTKVASFLIPDGTDKILNRIAERTGSKQLGVALYVAKQIAKPYVIDWAFDAVLPASLPTRMKHKEETIKLNRYYYEHINKFLIKMNSDHILDGRKDEDVSAVVTEYKKQQNAALFFMESKSIRALNKANEVCKSYVAEDLTELRSRLNKDTDTIARVQALQDDLELDIQQVDAICKAGEYLIHE